MDELKKSIHNYLIKHVNKIDYENWFKHLEPIKYENNEIFFSVPNQMIRDWIEDKLFYELIDAIRNVFNKDLKIHIKPLKNIVIPDEKNIYKHTDDFEKDETMLVRRYTFENFVIGNSNQFAHAAAFAVAKSPGDHYNPLFIYGSSGLGKTHLIQAIGHYIKQNSPNKKIAYITTESFMNEFIKAIYNGTMLDFKNKYRDLDVLLLDDIHFLKDKEKLQEEIFNTFNDLYNSNKQIVLTADRLPNEIPNLQERLITRFQWGLVVDIKKPDFETRLAILRKKVENEEIVVSDEILNYIANNIKNNIRLLEGVLVKIFAKAALANREVDINLAREIILDTKNINLNSNVKQITISAQEIINTVADYYKISKNQIMGNRRTKSVVLSRQIAIYLIRYYTDLSLKEIANFINKKDHSTIIHAINKIEKLRKTNQNINSDISRINSLLNVD